MGIKKTHVYHVNGMLVVADSIPQALEIYGAEYPREEITAVEILTSSYPVIVSTTSALIKDED